MDPGNLFAGIEIEETLLLHLRALSDDERETVEDLRSDAACEDA